MRPRWVAGLVMAAVLTTLVASGAPRQASAASATTVYRDQFGVPHIEASTTQGVAYALGYMTATDRLFEMDIIRKLAQGRLAELIGPGMLDSDRLTRREFVLQAGIAEQYQALTPNLKSLFQAYTKGVNDAATDCFPPQCPHIPTMLDPRTRPALFDVLADPWEAWKPEDSVTIDMLFTMVTFGGEGAAGELDNAKLLHDLQAQNGADEGLRTFNDIYPPTFADAPTVIAHGEGPPPPSASTGYGTVGPTASQQPLLAIPGIGAAAAGLAQEYERARVALADAHIPVPHIGSFGAAISGKRTQSGGGLLMGSPQSGLLSPPVFYEIGFHIPGVTDCEGFTVAGLGPAEGIGWCNQHAWTLVAGNMGDQADLYVERLNPANQHQYWLNGGWRNAVSKSTTYIVKSPICVPPCPPQVITETYDYTTHGAVVAPSGGPANTGFAYRRAQIGKFLNSLYGSAAWNFSKNLNDFMDGTDAFTASYNLLYADDQGHIAYRFTGLQPVRPGTDRRFPMPGTGEAEWQGFLSQCQMPHVIDPSAGYLAVNQGIESKSIEWWPNSSDIGVGAVSRVAHDQELLAAFNPATHAGMPAVTKRFLEQDDPFATMFYPYFAHALATTPASDANYTQLQSALGYLDQWKAGGFQRTHSASIDLEDHPGLAIFEMDDFQTRDGGNVFLDTPLGNALIDALSQRVFGAGSKDAIRGTYLHRASVVYDALSGRLHRDYIGDRDAFVRDAVVKVLGQLAKRFSTTDISKWHDTYPQHVWQALSAVGPPALHGWDHGSYSQIVDLGLPAGENVNPPGNLAHDSLPDSLAEQNGTAPAHWDDQRLMYQNYQFKPMRMTPTQYRANPEATLTLDDGGTFGADKSVDYSGHRDPCRQAVVTATSGGGGTPNTSAGWPVPVLILGALVVLGARLAGGWWRRRY